MVADISQHTITTRAPVGAQNKKKKKSNSNPGAEDVGEDVAELKDGEMEDAHAVDVLGINHQQHHQCFE